MVGIEKTIQTILKRYLKIMLPCLSLNTDHGLPLGTNNKRELLLISIYRTSYLLPSTLLQITDPNILQKKKFFEGNPFKAHVELKSQ